jgi:Rrf2 family iron-sulfur cluster assembly transcriptional regulator
MRLQLTRRSDYAVRAMTALAARPQETLSSARISGLTDIPARFVVPVMSDLSRAHLVDTVIGRSGGYRLRAGAGSITLLAVVDAVEGVQTRTLCALRQQLCGVTPCPLHGVLEHANNAFRDELAAISLASLTAAR